jgi:hypothetical protein
MLRNVPYVALLVSDQDKSLDFRAQVTRSRLCGPGSHQTPHDLGHDDAPEVEETLETRIGQN